MIKKIMCLSLLALSMASATVYASSSVESPALRVGNLVFISGQGGGLVNSPDDNGAAIEEAFQAIKTIAQQMGGDMSHIVKLDVYLNDIDHDFDKLNAIMPKYFKEPYPTRTTVGAKIPKNHTVEINAIMEVK